MELSFKAPSHLTEGAFVFASSFSLAEDPLESKIGETKSHRPQTHHNRRKICGKHAKTSGAKDTGVLHARELLVATLSTRTRFRQQLQG